MPEEPATQEDRSPAARKDERATVSHAPTSSDRDTRARDTEQPEDEKRIERFRER